jgi:hypothetical protein
MGKRKLELSVMEYAYNPSTETRESKVQSHLELHSETTIKKTKQN